jgi:ATP-dependent DNA helicase DinG
MIATTTERRAPLRAAFERLERAIPEFERRPGQMSMATLWAEALDRGGFVAVEAPTGIGKSLAYLLPAILRRVRGSGPVVVSTHTKALQEQLLTRDIPMVKAAVGSSLRVAVLKGRGSYLCRRRARARLAQRQLFRSFGMEGGAVEELERWMEQTTTGDLAELRGLGLSLPAAVSLEIASDALFCGSAGCDPASGCFAKLARREARKADVVIVNHALLLSDAGLRQTVVAEAGALVLDEAHHLERVAREQWGVSFGATDVGRLAGRSDARGGALRQLKRSLRRTDKGEVAARILEAEALIPPVVEQSRRFGQDLEALLRGGAPSARITRETDWLSVSPAALDQLVASMGSLSRGLQAAADAAENAAAGTLRPDAGDAVEEVRSRQMAWVELEQALRSVTRLEERDAAFFVDRDERGAARLNRRPLRVGEAFRAQVCSLCDRTLLTSATLLAEKGFGPFLESLGLGEDEVETAELPSPFPLDRQVLSAVFQGPEPTDPAFVERLADLVTGLATEVRRNTLVLLTSYQMLEDLAARVAAPLKSAGVRLLRQEPGEPAAPLVEEFREGRGAVLLGTASFWEGVDFPGAALEVLVVARLPFSVPTDPLVAARSEQIEQAGGDAFRDLLLPEAVLRFRQGIGRLIRTASDRGAVIVADPRIARAGYGRAFRAALPTEPVVERAPDVLVQGIARWFAEEASACPA